MQPVFIQHNGSSESKWNENAKKHMKTTPARTAAAPVGLLSEGKLNTLGALSVFLNDRVPIKRILHTIYIFST